MDDGCFRLFIHIEICVSIQQLTHDPFTVSTLVTLPNKLSHKYNFNRYRLN